MAVFTLNSVNTYRPWSTSSRLNTPAFSVVRIDSDTTTDIVSELQDTCPQSPMDAVNSVFQRDLGLDLGDVFDEFDATPIGSASLAQVHRATLKDGRVVAVKVQHYFLDDYAAIDIEATYRLTHMIKRIFPEFDLEWLADETKLNLPRELDFRIEAANSKRFYGNHRHHVELHVPEVYWATKRILCMEFIDGARVDDLEFMKKHGIDARSVARSLMDIFNESIFEYGFVHRYYYPRRISRLK
jgi:aarF domain-containing kinase